MHRNRNFPIRVGDTRGNDYFSPQRECRVQEMVIDKAASRETFRLGICAFRFRAYQL